MVPTFGEPGLIVECELHHYFPSSYCYVLEIIRQYVLSQCLVLITETKQIEASYTVITSLFIKYLSSVILHFVIHGYSQTHYIYGNTTNMYR